VITTGYHELTGCHRHRLAVDEIFSGVLKSNAWRFAQEKEDRRLAAKRDAEMAQCGCFYGDATEGTVGLWDVRGS
jgi:hypothetical protein